MGDHRASIKLEMDAHGKNYKTEMWINWSPDNDGCDRRVIEWFADCWADAYARYNEAIWEADKERREKEQEEADRAIFNRLKAKFEQKP